MTLTEGIELDSVHAVRHDEEVRLEVVDERHDDVLEDGVHVGVVVEVVQGHVERRPKPLALAHLVHVARIGVEKGVSVCGAVEHVGVGPEDVLGAVAVVHVPVEYEDLPSAVFGASILRTNGGIVEEAESLSLIGTRVVTRGSHDDVALGDGRRLIVHLIAERQDRPSRPQRRLGGVLAHKRIRPEWVYPRLLLRHHHKVLFFVDQIFLGRLLSCRC
mmetsp:Transcript_19335/g.46727  ORF Transcript_19335/g.46727 Transcript_19335/m.46727 type:complete len:217 (-) Transcript_19335:18-668(-)